MFKRARRNRHSQVIVVETPPPQNEGPHRFRVAFDELSDRDHGLPARVQLAVGCSMAGKDGVGPSDCPLHGHKEIWLTPRMSAPQRPPTFLVPTQLAKYEKPCAEHDRDIRHVEHSGTERSYAHVQEVHDAASKNAVYPIRSATRNKEDKSELRRSRVLPSEGQPQQCHQGGPCRDREDSISRDGRQVGPKTQKSASIFGVANAYRVRQERAVRSAGEIRRSGVLGDPVAANRSEGGDDQKECSGPHHFG